MADAHLPDDLKGKPHWDYPWFMRWVPRAWTTFRWGVPVKILGNQERIRVGRDVDGAVRSGPAPIGERGSWQLSEHPRAPWWAWFMAGLAWVAIFAVPGWWKAAVLLTLPFQHVYFAFRLKNGWHFRVGGRWDDVGGYTTVPSVAIRHYGDDPGEDTSTN